MVESKTLQPSIFRVSMCKIIIHNLVVVVSREVGRKLEEYMSHSKSVYPRLAADAERGACYWMESCVDKD